MFVGEAGAVHQADKAFLNVDGDILECKVFVNDGGVIREIK